LPKTINLRLIETVARGQKSKLQTENCVDDLGEKGTEAETYQGMLIANTHSCEVDVYSVSAISLYLSGKCDR